MTIDNYHITIYLVLLNKKFEIFPNKKFLNSDFVETAVDSKELEVWSVDEGGACTPNCPSQLGRMSHVSYLSNYDTWDIKSVCRIVTG